MDNFRFNTIAPDNTRTPETTSPVAAFCARSCCSRRYSFRDCCSVFVRTIFLTNKLLTFSYSIPFYMLLKNSAFNIAQHSKTVKFHKQKALICRFKDHPPISWTNFSDQCPFSKTNTSLVERWLSLYPASLYRFKVAVSE